MNKCTKPIQKINEEVKSNNFCDCKVRRAITKWGAIEKVQYCNSKNGISNIFVGH